MTKKLIRLSPLNRLTFSFDKELDLDEKGVFNREIYELYIERQHEVQVKQDRLIRSLVMLNAAIFLLLNGQTWIIPGVGVQVSKIPAIQEILLYLSSMTFFILCAYFVNNQCYSSIIDHIGNRIVDSRVIDPDFYNASRKHYDYFLKLFRPKMNIWGDDFYQHEWGFAVFSWLMNAIVILVVIVIPATHISLIWAASLQVYQSECNQYARWFLLVSVAVINAGGLAMVIGMSKGFNFRLLEPPSGNDN